VFFRTKEQRQIQRLVYVAYLFGFAREYAKATDYNAKECSIHLNKFSKCEGTFLLGKEGGAEEKEYSH